MNCFCPDCGDVRETMETIQSGIGWQIRFCRACGITYKFSSLTQGQKKAVDKITMNIPLLTGKEHFEV